MRLISFFIIIFLFTQIAQAELSSEFGLSLSKTSLNKFLKQISGDFNIVNEEVDLGEEGVLKDIKYRSAKFSLDADLDFAFADKNILEAQALVKSAELKFEDFKYVNVTVVNRSGVRAIVTTRVTCPVLKIKLKNWESNMRTPLEFSKGRLMLNQAGGVFEITGDDLSVDLSTCSGPKGADIVFKETLLDWIRSRQGNETVFGAVLDYGQEFIDEELEKLKKSLDLSILNKKIALDVESISFANDKVEIIGLLSTESKKNDYRLLVNQADFEKVKTEADMIFPKSFFSQFFPDFFKEASLSMELTRAEIPGVDILFKSRIIQFFVWRDLLNFKKKSNFSVKADFKTEALDLVSSEKSFKYVFRGDHSIGMDFLNEKGAHFPYMNFSGALSTDLDLSVGVKGLSIKLSKPFLTAGARWHEDMRSWRKSKTKKKPNMRILTPRIKDALEGTEFDFSWDDLGLGKQIENAELYHSETSSFLSLKLK